VKKPPIYLPEIIEFVEANLSDAGLVALALAALLTDPDSFDVKPSPFSAKNRAVSEWILKDAVANELIARADVPVSRVLFESDWLPVWRHSRSPSSVPTSFKYDVCISFAGQDREVAEGIAEALKTAEIPRRVFYDNWEKNALLGENLYNYLHDVYSSQSMYCVILFSHAYRDRAWTRHELRSAQTRLLRDREAYVIPIAIDANAIPDVFASVGYWGFHGGEEAAIADALEEKVNDYIGNVYSSIEEVADAITRDQIARAILAGFKAGESERPVDSSVYFALALIAAASVTDLSDKRIRALIDLVLNVPGPIADAFDSKDSFLVFEDKSIRRTITYGEPLMVSTTWEEHIKKFALASSDDEDDEEGEPEADER
jgi:hypothetical protein